MIPQVVADVCATNSSEPFSVRQLAPSRPPLVVKSPLQFIVADSASYVAPVDTVILFAVSFVNYAVVPVTVVPVILVAVALVNSA